MTICFLFYIRTVNKIRTKITIMKTPCSKRLQRREWYCYAILLVLVFLFFSAFSAKAQTTLVSGDIAFTGYLTRSSPTADTVSFIVLKAGGITAGTVVNFTDNGWLPSGIGRAGGEGIVQWTANRFIRYGEQVKLIVSAAPSSDKGAVTKLSGTFDLASSGDQLFAFTGTWPSPDVLLAGLHFNKIATTTQQGWDVNSNVNGSGEFSVYPSTLCSGCGIWVTDPAATGLKITTGGYYNGGYHATPEVLRGMVNSNANWNNTFSAVTVAPAWRVPPVITLPDTVPVIPDTVVTATPDTAAPHVIAVASNMPDGVYKAGDEINILVYFDKNVVVNTSAGVPFLQLNVGNTSSRAVYVTGSCGSALTFLYTVQPGDTSVRLDYLAPDALKLNNGTIQNNTANSANVILPASGATLATLRSLVINAVAPQVTPYQSFPVDRYSNNGTAAGVVKAVSHGPAGTSLQNWTIAQGNVQGAFSINSATGQLLVANESVLHDPAYTGFTLMITVSDGTNTSAPEEVMVLLREVALDDTVHFIADSLYESKPAGVQAGVLNLTSGNTTAVYSLVAGTGDADNSLFTITGNALQTGTTLDYEQQQQYHVRVRATIQSRYIDTALVIDLHNVNEPPVIDAVANQVVCENAGLQILSLTGITCGPEADQCVTVAVTTDNPSFFAQLLVIRDSDGTTVLRYKVKDSTAGQAHVTITVKDNGGNANGGVDSATVTFMITAKAAGKVTITAGGNTSIADNETVTLTAVAEDASGTYQWLRNGEPVPDARNTTYKADTAHAGAYQCTITSTEGCVATSNIIVVAKANTPVNLMVFPNPTNGKVFIMFTGYLERYMQVVIHNSAGAEVLRKKIWHSSDTQKDEIDLSAYSAGIYIIELITDSGEKLTSANVIKN